jgi:radical SAM superfamily enzyme YgiQ (UPF0313 family)
MIVLAIPPGWTLHPGGAHIALPLLQGYLRQRGIDTRLYDMNIGSATHHRATITESSVRTACENLSASRMNEVYFNVEDRLGDIAKSFGGKWLAHEGYQHLDCDLGDPESVRKYSRYPSPFTDYFKKKVIPEILGLNPKIVGLSLYVPSQMLTTFEFVRLLRAAGYEGFVALGGNMISRIAKDMKHEWVFDLIDGLTTYQGERALEELYQSIKAGAALDGIPNLTWRNSDGQIVENNIDLLKPNQFAPPDFEGLHHDEYWGTKYFTMVGARGCFYGKCSFCAIPFGWGPGNYIGMAAGSAVVRAMNNAYTQFGVRRFKFIDEALHPRMLREMDAVRSEYAADFIFEGYVRLDPTWSSTEFLQLCHRVGLRKAYLGLELAPSDTRDVLNKADRGDPVLIFQRMKDLGIKTHVFCLFGFPGTGIDEALATTDFALKHSEKIDTLDIFPFYFARHTKVERIKIVEENARTWRTEHKYEPDAPGVLWPEEVEHLTERMNAIVWRERPQWSHPVYRMYSPWHDSAGAL